MSASLAAVLYAQAKRTLPLLSDEARAPSLAAIDRFVAKPGPSAFLSASRELSTALRRCQFDRLLGAASRRRFQRGLEAVRAVPGLDGSIAEELGSLPLDGRAGRRLDALAALLTTHHELTGRVAAASDELRRMLDFDSFEPSPPPRRRAAPSAAR